MIIGIGTDMVTISRMEKWEERPGLLEKYFHGDELAYARNKGHQSAASLAASFAAKEAFGKALGTGLTHIRLKDIAALREQSGRPYLRLEGTALKAFQERGGLQIHLSLTHEGQLAAAVVVIEGGN